MYYIGHIFCDEDMAYILFTIVGEMFRMTTTGNSTFANSLIWFGAAISIAEIMTGALLAPLGPVKGVLAAVTGHFIGAVLMYFTGLIGAHTKSSAMDTVKFAFGKKGSYLFSTLNIIQLIGWTAVMIFAGASAANFVFSSGEWIWAIVIGALIILWIAIGITNLGPINIVAMSLLFVLTIVLSSIVFEPLFSQTPMNFVAGGEMTFGLGVELSVAMPLSWLPLISDYTKEARNGKASSFAGAAVYFFASCWMYIIGLFSALFTGESDVAQIMVMAGLGFAGLIIIIFSTVTTTFLDAYSAGVSSESISKLFSAKTMAIAITILGTLLAIFSTITNYESFLYFIGSVFAPMIAILIVSYYMLKQNHASMAFDWVNLVLWAIGFGLYRYFMELDTPIGNTVPVMVIVGLLCYTVNRVLKR